MQSSVKQLRTETSWPPERGEVIAFKSSTGDETAPLLEVRWGLVWRDFILQDGRVIPEHRVSGCPHPQEWRKTSDVTADERERCEERLLSMAQAGMDPRRRDETFWAELNQYLAYTYLRFKQGRSQPQDQKEHHKTSNKE